MLVYVTGNYLITGNVGDKVLHILPFFSPLGADNNFVLNLASGSMNIDVPEFEISEFGYLIKKYHPNVILVRHHGLHRLQKVNIYKMKIYHVLKE